MVKATCDVIVKRLTSIRVFVTFTSPAVGVKGGKARKAFTISARTTIVFGKDFIGVVRKENIIRAL